jgi:hypothetical protein
MAVEGKAELTRPCLASLGPTSTDVYTIEVVSRSPSARQAIEGIGGRGKGREDEGKTKRRQTEPTRDSPGRLVPARIKRTPGLGVLCGMMRKA